MKKTIFILMVVGLILGLYPSIGLAQTQSTDLPDLIVGDIKYNDEQSYFKVNYCNRQGQGTSDVKFSIKLSSSKCSTCSIIIGGDATNYAVPAPGYCADSEPVGKNWFGIGTDSSVEMTVIVDYGKLVEESSEGNNILVKTVVVSSPSTPDYNPTNIFVNYNSDKNSVMVEWLNPDTLALAYGNIYRSDIRGQLGSRVGQVILGGRDANKKSSFENKNITRGKTYYYTVRLETINGNESTNTDQYSVKIPGLPDLTVSNITYSNDQFYVNYCNQGQGISDVKFSINLSSERCLTCNITIGGDAANYAVPAPGQCAMSEAVGKNWFGIGTDSSVKMTAIVDYGATVEESDENNNIFIGTVALKQPLPSTSETKHFIMTVKWGNVRGDVSDKAEAIFDGSVSSDDSSVRISLIRELLFEDHDLLFSKKDPVSWISLIYGHWDGVRVLVSAPTTATITVDVGQGSVSKTVQELFELTEPLVVDVGNGKEIVIKGHPYKKRSVFMTVFWGDGPKGQKADFSGSLTLAGGSEMKFKRALRFEKNDEILTDSTTDITWNSIIVGGKDGLLFRVRFGKKVDDSDTLTISFSGLNWSKTFRLIDLYHDRITREVLSNTTILPCSNSSADENNVLTACKTTGQIARASTRPYHLIIALKQDQHTNKRLIKHKNSPAVYMIEDGIKKPIISAEVFEDNKLDWSKVETVEQEEVESYAEGDILNYPDGVLVKGSGPAVYIIAGGRKRPVKSAAAFLRLGYKWEHIRTIRDAEVNAYPTDSYVTETSDHPEGALVREKGKTGVYVIKGGKKRPIRSADIFETHGYKWDRVLEVEKSALDKFQDGDAETYPDGTLVQGEGQGGVYIIDKGKKRAFKSAKDFLSMKKEWSNIKKIKASELNALSSGEDMIGQ